jgi:type IV pilus assembly protein PilA
MKKVNNKGFTLVELLAVLVIMIAIAAIAIPTISAALDRSRGNLDDQKKKLLESAAEIYVSEHKNSFNGTCISIETLYNEGYIDEDAANDSNGNKIEGNVSVDIENGEYKFQSGSSNGCV